MRTYKQNTYSTSKLKVNKSTEGEPLEHKIERVVNSKEPIKDGAPQIFTERKDGVKPETNIRTDRFEVALEATTKVKRSYQTRREERHKPKEVTKTQEGQNDPLSGNPSQSKASE